MSNILWILLALFAGTMLPLQGALNTKLGHEGQSPFHASMISFIIGAISVALYVFLTRQNVSWTGLRGATAYAWLGGILGAFYVTVIILAFPKLGPGLTFALVVAGQMIISMLLEHFDILVAQQNPITAVRLGGVALIIAGVILIKFF
jgi:bacterial/archaeal transporter family-2 protein